MRVSLSRWRAWWDGACAAEAQALAAIPPPRLPLALVAVSTLTIHAALVLIRWPVFCFPAFVWLPVLGLSACFLGFGIGCGRTRSAVAGCLPLLAVQAVVLAVCRALPATGQTTAVAATVIPLTALFFIPLGSLTSRLMLRLPHRRASVLCVLGGLLGVAVSPLLSLLWTPPNAVWALAWLSAGPLVTGPARRPALAAASLLSVTVGLMAPPAGQGESGGCAHIGLSPLTLGLCALAVVSTRRARRAERPTSEAAAKRAA